MTKAPPNTPEKGDRCYMRGNPDRLGHVRKICSPESEIRHGCMVKWDDNPTLQFTHLYELEKVTT